MVELARRKARAVLARVPQAGWLIAADTAVLIGADLVGKPADRDSARATLERLAGAVHHVLTGVALATPDGVLDVAMARTAVTFARLSGAEIDWYLDTGEWRGAAGGYRIQGRAALLATHLQGSYSNVVGLPLETIYRMLARNGYRFAARTREGELVGRRYHEEPAGVRSTLRTPDQALGSAHAAVHLRRAQWHPHHRPAEDDRGDQGRVRNRAPECPGRQARAVRRHQEAGAAVDRT